MQRGADERSQDEEQERAASGHARDVDSEDAIDRVDARLRRRAAHPDAVGGRADDRRGIAVSGAARMLVKGWVLAEWKISVNNRRARFYTLTTAGAKKGGAAVGPTRRGKGSKTMAICDRHGLPVAVHVASASPYEPHLVPAPL